LKNRVKLAHKEGPKDKEALSVKTRTQGSLIKALPVNNGWYFLGCILAFVGLH
jgi:hypothetical protein